MSSLRPAVHNGSYVADAPLRFLVGAQNSTPTSSSSMVSPGIQFIETARYKAHISLNVANTTHSSSQVESIEQST